MNKTWSTKKLGEVVEELDLKKTPNGSWPYIEIGDIDIENKTIIFKDKKSIKGAIIAPADSVLVSRVRPTRGAITLINKDYPASSAFTILKAKTSETSSKFLFYWLGYSRDFLVYLQRKQKGSNYPSVREKDVLNFKISIPPFSIQQKIVERLDKIAEAQKLNDKQIELAEELFQSLLHRELNPKGKNWKENKFVNCIEKNPLKIKGIPREKYQSIGKFPIIDQSDKFIVGYMDNEDKVYKIDSPVIIFGDHTRIFKYIDFNFAIGADGTQIIIPNRKIIIPKFFYFLMLNLKINNLGYSRHFKILKTKKIIIPPFKIQKQIVEKLSAVQEYKKKLLEQKQKLQELFESVLSKSMKRKVA